MPDNSENINKPTNLILPKPQSPQTPPPPNTSINENYVEKIPFTRKSPVTVTPVVPNGNVPGTGKSD